MNDLLPRADELVPFAPEIVLLLAMLAVLVVPMFFKRKHILQAAIAAAASVGVTLLAAIYARAPAVEHPASYFGGLLLHDPFGWAVKMLLIGGACVVMALWFTDSHDKFIRRRQTQDAPEFFMLLLAATLGFCLMASSTHLLTIFLAIEISSLPTYALIAFRKGHRSAARSVMKFILVGCASTALMLYGMSLLYGLFGTLDLQQIGTTLTEKKWQLQSHGPKGFLFAIGILCLLIGPAFKIAIAPLQTWFADVSGSSTIDVATFLSVASPTAGLALLMRILFAVTGPGGAVGDRRWLGVLVLIFGAASAMWAAFAALRQTNIKRLLAWSTLAHAGFILVAMVGILLPACPGRNAAVLGPTLVASPPAEALLFYLFTLLFMNGGAFVSAAAIAQRLTGPVDAGMSLGVERFTPAAPPPVPAGPPSATGEELREYAGLSRRAPILAALMLLCLLSLCGMPLTIGFAGRMKLLGILFECGLLGWIGIAAIALGSLVLAVAYFRVIRQIYLVETDAPHPIEIAPVTLVALVLVVPNVFLFIAYSTIDRQTQRHAQLLSPSSAESNNR
ncbi:MAG: hypothetical protein FWD61_17925 [Phycisphaerales bacterium]|nr:hypothetical protein [Phycisphaerales bacterium]